MKWTRGSLEKIKGTLIGIGGTVMKHVKKKCTKIQHYKVAKG